MDEWFDVTSAFEQCTRRVSYQGLYEVVSDSPIAPDVKDYLYQNTLVTPSGYVHSYKHINLCSSEKAANGNILGALTVSR